MKNKFLNYSIVFIILIFFVAFESIVNANKDFDIFIAASKFMFEGKTCYNVWFNSAGNGLKYFYSPLFGILIYPLTFLPQYFYNVFWMILNLLVLYRLFILCKEFLINHKKSAVKFNIVYILTLLCTIRVILYNFDLGQMTIILVWASLEGLRLIYSKKILLGSALIALIINIKILPIVVLCYLIYKKEFKASLYIIGFSIIYLIIPIVCFGIDFNNVLLHDWYNTLTDFNTNSIKEDLGRQSLSSLIPSLFMETKSTIPLKRNLFQLNEETVKHVLLVVRLLFLASLIPLLGKPFHKEKNVKTVFYQIATILIITPIFFPHQGKYSLLFLLPAYAYCLYTLLRLKQIIKEKQHFAKPYKMAGLLLILSFCFITLTTDGLIGRSFADIAEHYHLLVFGAICLLIATIMLKPKTSF